LLWNGHGTVLDAQGAELGRVHWRLSRRALFGGIHLDLDADGAHGSFSGRMQRLAADQVDWQDVKLRLDAATLAALAPGLGWPLGGVVDVKIDRARLQGNWPMELDAQARWLDAAVTTADGRLALGRWRLEANGQDGAIRAKLEDAGGPLQVAGRLQLSPLGWHVAATLTPRTGDPALRRWLATLAPPGADGAVHLERAGGLGAAATMEPR